MRIRNRLAHMAIATILSVTMVPSIGVFAAETTEPEEETTIEVNRSEVGSIALALPIQQKYSESGTIPAGLNRTFDYVLIADDVAYPMPEGSEWILPEGTEETEESAESSAAESSEAYEGEELLTYSFSLTGNETLELPDMVYTHAGVYTYTVAPVLPETLIDRMTYDRQIYQITVAVVNVEVEEDGEIVDKLGIQVFGDDGTEYKPSNIIFTNSYAGPTPSGGGGNDDNPPSWIDTIGEVLGVNRDTIKPVDEEGEVLGESRNPQTSDMANALLWIAVLALAGAGIVTVSVSKHKNSK